MQAHRADIPEMLDCAHCGAETQYVAEYYSSPRGVCVFSGKCIECEAQGPIAASKVEAVELWNDRVSPRDSELEKWKAWTATEKLQVQIEAQYRQHAESERDEALSEASRLKSLIRNIRIMLSKADRAREAENAN